MFMGFQATPDSLLTNREYVTSVTGLDKSLMGMESRGGGGGGGGGLTSDQIRYQDEKWKFDYQQLADKHAFSMDAFYTTQFNEEKMRQHKTATATQEWVDKEKMRIFDYNNQVEAYNASVGAYEVQRDYNQIAAEIQINDNTRKYNEQLQEIGFKNEDRLMNLGFNKRDLTMKLQGQKAAISQKAQGALLEGLQKQGATLASGQTGRSARKNIQAALAHQGSVQAALVDQITREQTGYQFALDKAELSAKFAEQQLIASKDSALSQYEADTQTTKLQKYSADLQAEAAIAPEPQEPPQMSAPLELPQPEVNKPPGMVTPEQWADLRPPTDVGGGSTSGGFLGMVMAGAQVAGAFGISDDRLKSTYNRVGTSPSGIPVYTFRYIHDGAHGPWYKGTSAQDLIAMGRKDAIGQTEKDGFYYVDYSKLDVDFEKVQV